MSSVAEWVHAYTLFRSPTSTFMDAVLWLTHRWSQGSIPAKNICIYILNISIKDHAGGRKIDP